MKAKDKAVQLPFFIPTMSSMHSSLALELVLAKRETASIQFLNQVTNLTCKRIFLNGFTGLDLYFCNVNTTGFPNVRVHEVDLTYAVANTRAIIKRMLDDGLYVFFMRIDDYYTPGKSFFGIKHKEHDGIISGYNNSENTFTIIAYNNEWVLKSYKISQDDFINSVEKSIKYGFFPTLRGMRAKKMITELDIPMIIKGLKAYLAEPKNQENDYTPVRGNCVHDYFAMYIDKIIDGAIPHERMDWRPMRMIWEFRVKMLERIKAIEEKLSLGGSISQRYTPIVKEDDRLRGLYALCTKKLKPAILTMIKETIKKEKLEEQKLLRELIASVQEK